MLVLPTPVSLINRLSRLEIRITPVPLRGLSYADPGHDNRHFQVPDSL